jgi:4-amino-4-deoxy-L-arabinose transferase-like glycosyltransferase
VLFAFAAIFILAAYVRFADLGGPGFLVDEMYHVYAARGILEGRGPVFESGDQYRRAVEVTWLVAASFAWLGESEYSARLPSVLVSIAFLIVSTIWVRREFGALTAAIYALFLGLAPFEVMVGRMVRMYPLFQALFCASAVALYYAFERQPGTSANPSVGERLARSTGVNAGFLIVGLILLHLSNRLHALTGTIAVAMLCYVLFCALMSCLRLLPESSRWGGRYTVYLALILLAPLVLYHLAPDKIEAAIFNYSQPLPWAKYHNHDPSFYTYLFQENYPWVIFALPIGLVLIFRDKPRLAIFLFSMSVGILTFLSFSERGTERYSYHVFPFLIIPSCYALSFIVREIWKATTQHSSSSPIYFRSAAAVGILALVYGVCSPWRNASGHTVDKRDWKTLATEHPELTNSESIILATNQNQATYYLGRKPDYYVRAEYDFSPGDPEYYQRIEVIRSAAELREVVNSSAKVFLISDAWPNDRVFYSTDMQELVKSQFTRINPDTRSDITVWVPKSQHEQSVSSP